MKMLNSEYSPQNYLVDECLPVSRATRKVFSEETKLRMCFFRVKKRVKDIIKKEIPKIFCNHKNFIEKDLNMLYECTNNKVFDAALDLFLKKWKPRISVFIKYFEDQLVNTIPGWHLGYVMEFHPEWK